MPCVIDRFHVVQLTPCAFQTNICQSYRMFISNKLDSEIDMGQEPVFSILMTT